MAVGVLLHKIMMKENSLNRITVILVTYSAQLCSARASRRLNNRP